MKKFLCIHGHFYQPPRENPWSGEVDAEPSAKPFHDWNERISKECYEANTHAPLLNSKGDVTARLNTFSRISFDIGPTLLSWLRGHEYGVYKAILKADRESADRFSGHGNAMAQIYNHVIMPLAEGRDKVTQIHWGVRDFEFHYGRKPEGMWLSETAVDRQTLGLMADAGIRFTVLAPHQAKRIRRIGFGRHWEAVSESTLETGHPYRVLLENGRHFHVFFYDAGLAQGIAFQGLLNSGDAFFDRILGAFHNRRENVSLVCAATDGESYGHHHRFGEMALAYLLKKVEDSRAAVCTNFGEFLDRHSSHWEADLHENTSWSCAHGVERWRSDCGCRLKQEPGWNQKWRAPLREAFDFLKKAVDKSFEQKAGRWLKDPWQARNHYIDVMLENTPARRKEFLSRQARRRLSPEQEKIIWDLLEAQKFSLFTFTSCGWFFDDVSGIEPVQLMKFALRAIELAGPFAAADLESRFLALLSGAKSNVPGEGTAADIFLRRVKPEGRGSHGI